MKIKKSIKNKIHKTYEASKVRTRNILTFNHC